MSSFFAAAFIYSANYASTLITNARYDTIIIGTSIVPALRDYIAENPTFGLTRVAYEGDDQDAPSETIRLELVRSEILGRGGTRFVHFPSFPRSGHYVSVSEPERLSTTIAQFLASTGLRGE